MHSSSVSLHAALGRALQYGGAAHRLLSIHLSLVVLKKVIGCDSNDAQQHGTVWISH